MTLCKDRELDTFAQARKFSGRQRDIRCSIYRVVHERKSGHLFDLIRSILFDCFPVRQKAMVMNF